MIFCIINLNEMEQIPFACRGINIIHQISSTFKVLYSMALDLTVSFESIYMYLIFEYICQR